MKRFLCLLILCLPITTMAQDSVTGIQWTTGLTWQQIKQKAKVENKYIFLDCYATWCGPCKEMDKNVFVDDSVGQFFNDKFISVKVQMDKTAKDSEDIKNWYTDADAINKEYHINALPTFVFFNPQGEATDIQTGYREVKDFKEIATVALKPGKIYADPYKRYWSLLDDFNNGIVKQDSLDYMIEIATAVNDTISRPQLMSSYKNYMASLKPNDRYTRTNIEFWATLNLSSKSSLFRYVLKGIKRIDKVKYKGFAFSMISKTIHNELVLPFFEKENKNPSVAITGGYATALVGKINTDSSEADWNKLYSVVRKYYNETITHRMVLQSRIEWYKRHQNSDGMYKIWLAQLNKYPEDLAISFFAINNQAWSAFKNGTDEKTLKSYTELMKVIVELHKTATPMDTYANLLYKIGKVKEAIEWQGKAVTKNPNDKGLQKALEQMKKGLPTYGVQPLLAINDESIYK